MKTKFFFLPLMLIFLSCTDSMQETLEQKTETPQPDFVGSLGDGGELREDYHIEFRCVEYSPQTGLPIASSVPQKPFFNYSSMVFSMTIPNRVDEDWQQVREVLDDKGKRELWTLLKDFYKAKCALLVDAYFKKYTTIQSDGSWPAFFTAYINGGVSVICDKTLFGEAPGCNLARHFSFESYPCMMVGIDEPILVYGFDDELPTDADGVFPQGAWLKAAYSMRFRDIPSEKYDDITFTLSIPVIREHCRKYIVYQYMGKELESKFSECTITGECHLQFDWK